MNDFLKLAEELDWSYNVDDTPNERGEVCVELEKYSPTRPRFHCFYLVRDGQRVRLRRQAGGVLERL